MSSTRFAPVGSYSGRLLYIQLWYGMFYMQYYKQSHVEGIKKLKY